VVDLLVGVRHFTRATLFLEACREFGLLCNCEASSTVFAGYARYLTNLGLPVAAEYYDGKSSEKGEKTVSQTPSA